MHDETHFASRPHPSFPNDPHITQSVCLDIEGCDECEISMGIEEIYELWGKMPAVLFARIYALNDAYGEKGYIPPQGYDWSGIRDSSNEAKRQMIALMHS